MKDNVNTRVRSLALDLKTIQSLVSDALSHLSDGGKPERDGSDAVSCLIRRMPSLYDRIFDHAYMVKTSLETDPMPKDDDSEDSWYDRDARYELHVMDYEG